MISGQSQSRERKKTPAEKANNEWNHECRSTQQHGVAAAASTGYIFTLVKSRQLTGGVITRQALVLDRVGLFGIVCLDASCPLHRLPPSEMLRDINMIGTCSQ